MSEDDLDSIPVITRLDDLAALSPSVPPTQQLATVFARKPAIAQEVYTYAQHCVRFPLSLGAKTSPSSSSYADLTLDDLREVCGVSEEDAEKFEGAMLFSHLSTAEYAYVQIQRRLKNIGKIPGYRRTDFESDEAFEQRNADEVARLRDAIAASFQKSLLSGSLQATLVSIDFYAGSAEYFVIVSLEGKEYRSDPFKGVEEETAAVNFTFSCDVSNPSASLVISLVKKKIIGGNKIAATTRVSVASIFSMEGGGGGGGDGKGGVEKGGDGVWVDLAAAEGGGGGNLPAANVARVHIRGKYNVQLVDPEKEIAVISHANTCQNLVDLLLLRDTSRQLVTGGDSVHGLNENSLNVINDFGLRYGVGHPLILTMIVDAYLRLNSVVLVEPQSLETLVYSMLDALNDTVPLAVTESDRLRLSLERVRGAVFDSLASHVRYRRADMLHDLLNVLELTTDGQIFDTSSEGHSRLIQIIRMSATKRADELTMNSGTPLNFLSSPPPLPPLILLVSSCQEETEEDAGNLKFGGNSSNFLALEAAKVYYQRARDAVSSHFSLVSVGNNPEDDYFDLHSKIGAYHNSLEELELTISPLLDRDELFAGFVQAWTKKKTIEYSSFVKNALGNDSFESVEQRLASESAYDLCQMCSGFLQISKTDLGIDFLPQIARGVVALVKTYVSSVKELAVTQVAEGDSDRIQVTVWDDKSNPTWKEMSSAVKVSDITKLKSLQKEALEQGGSIATWRNHRNRTLLHIACRKGGNATLIHFLIDSGVGPDMRADDGSTALHYASKTCNATAIRTLLNHHADPALKTVRGKSAADVVGNLPNREACEQQLMEAASGRESRLFDAVLEPSLCVKLNNIQNVYSQIVQMLEEMGEEMLEPLVSEISSICSNGLDELIQRVVDKFNTVVILGVGQSLMAPFDKQRSSDEQFAEREQSLSKALSEQFDKTLALLDRSVCRRLLRELWEVILCDFEEFLFPPKVIVGAPQIRLLRVLLEEDRLPAFFESADVGLKKDALLRSKRYLKLQVLFALFSVPTRKLIDMFGRVEEATHVRKAWGLLPDDILRVLYTRRESEAKAAEFVQQRSDVTLLWKLRKKFNLDEDETVVMEIPCVSESLMRGKLTLTSRHVCFDTVQFSDRGCKVAIPLKEITVALRSEGVIAIATREGFSKRHRLMIQSPSSMLKVGGVYDVDAVHRAILTQARLLGNVAIREPKAHSEEILMLVKEFGIDEDEAIANVFDCHVFNKSSHKGRLFLLFPCIVFKCNVPDFHPMIAFDKIDSIDLLTAPDGEPMIQIAPLNQQTLQFVGFNDTAAAAHSLQTLWAESKRPRGVVKISVPPHISDQSAVTVKIDSHHTADQVVDMVVKKLRLQGVPLALLFSLPSAETVMKGNEELLPRLEKLKRSGQDDLHLSLRLTTPLPHLQIACESDSFFSVRVESPLPVLGPDTAFFHSPPGHNNLYFHAFSQPGTRWLIHPIHLATPPHLSVGDLIQLRPERHRSSRVHLLKGTKVRVSEEKNSQDVLQVVSPLNRTGSVLFGDIIAFRVYERLPTTNPTPYYLAAASATQEVTRSSFDPKSWYVKAENALTITESRFFWSIRTGSGLVPSLPSTYLATKSAGLSEGSETSGAAPPPPPAADEIDSWNPQPHSSSHDPHRDAMAEMFGLPPPVHVVAQFSCSVRAGFPVHQRGRIGAMYLFSNFVCFKHEDRDNPAMNFMKRIALTTVDRVQAETAFFFRDSVSLYFKSSQSFLEFTGFFDADVVAKSIDTQLKALRKEEEELEEEEGEYEED